MVATRRGKATASAVDNNPAEREVVKSDGEKEGNQGMKMDTAQEDPRDDNNNKTGTDANAHGKEEPTNSASGNKPQDDSSSSSGGDNKENPEAAAKTADESADGEKKNPNSTEEGNHNIHVVPPPAAAMHYHPFYPPPPGYFPPMQSWGGTVPPPPPPPQHYGGGYPHVYYPPPHHMHGMPYYPPGGPTTGGGGPAPPHHPHAYHPQHYPTVPNPQHFLQQPIYSPGEDGDDESKQGQQSVGAVVKTYVKCAKARNPDVLIRRQKKNQASRKRADISRAKMAEISAKPRHERTDEEQSQLEAYEDRRNKKNERSKERSRETKETLDYILSKPAHKRTKVEIAFLEQNMSAKQRKNEGDRLRRERLKKLGLDRPTGGSGGTAKPGISARGPLPAEYAAKLGGTSTDGSNNSVANDAPRSKPPRVYARDVMPGAAPSTSSSSYPVDSPYGNPLPPHPYESWESHEQVYLPPPPPLDTSSDTGMIMLEAKASPSFAPPTPHAV
jgi:hypothetical protein